MPLPRGGSGDWQRERARAILAGPKLASGSKRERFLDSIISSGDFVNEQREILFSGHVQGVGFRYTTRGIARQYPVTGFVQNLADGRVRLVVEGVVGDLDSILDELQERMDGFITQIHVDRRETSGTFNTFDIRY